MLGVKLPVADVILYVPPIAADAVDVGRFGINVQPEGADRVKVVLVEYRNVKAKSGSFDVVIDGAVHEVVPVRCWSVKLPSCVPEGRLTLTTLMTNAVPDVACEQLTVRLTAVFVTFALNVQ